MRQSSLSHNHNQSSGNRPGTHQPDHAHLRTRHADIRSCLTLSQTNSLNHRRSTWPAANAPSQDANPPSRYFGRPVPEGIWARWTGCEGCNVLPCETARSRTQRCSPSQQRDNWDFKKWSRPLAVCQTVSVDEMEHSRSGGHTGGPRRAPAASRSSPIKGFSPADAQVAHKGEERELCPRARGIPMRASLRFPLPRGGGGGKQTAASPPGSFPKVVWARLHKQDRRWPQYHIDWALRRVLECHLSLIW